MKSKNQLQQPRINAIFILIALFSGFSISAQNDQLKFNAVSRTFQKNNKLQEEDTVNADRTSSGYTLMDLGVNINPDRKTEIQAIIRFKTDLGGFFGDGTELDLRQIRVKGTVKEVVNYEVGDLYLKLSPFTLYNENVEGAINEATVFSDIRRDIANYENLNRDNFWWQQGAHIDFGLEFEKVIHQMNVDGFFLRNRGTDFISVPNSFYAGGRINIQQSKNLGFKLNYINLFDDGASVNSEQETRNPVASTEIDYTYNGSGFDMLISGEAGLSKLIFIPRASVDSADIVIDPDDYQDVFFDFNSIWKHKKNGLQAGLGYRYVGPEFYSAGAQSKRINFSQNPTTFTGVNNNPFSPRGIGLFDLTRDANVYNPVITRQLMAYDPRLSNAMPYGVATPNRKGLNLALGYKSKGDIVHTSFKASVLSDVVGEGSPEKRKFKVLRLGLDLNINKAIDWEKSIVFKTGIQHESTKRNDSLGVDLKSSLIDVGLDIEVFKQFDLLLGAKRLRSKGKEFYFARDQFNQLGLPAAMDIDQSETLYGVGLKYRFNEKIYLTAQNHFFSFANKKNAEQDYGFNQVFILFNMKL